MGTLVAVMGHGRAGKDTTADYLVRNYRFVRVALADPMKRFCAEVFDFDSEQLHGDKRDAPDLRYIRTVERAGSDPETEVVTTSYLTPRYALQTLGTQWGRDCYPNVWIEYGIRVSKKILSDPHSFYTAAGGLGKRIIPVRTAGVVFSDLRFKNEHAAMRAAGAILVRIHRPGLAPLGGISGHASEEEQKQMRDEDFDVVLHNTGTIEDLYEQIDDKLFDRLHNSGGSA